MWGYVVDADKEEFIRYLNTNGSEKCKFYLMIPLLKNMKRESKERLTHLAN